MNWQRVEDRHAILIADHTFPAQIRFRGASGIVFNFPGLWRERRGRGESLSPGIRSCRQKSWRGLWPRQTFSRRELAVPTETGSTLDRDGFESEGLRRQAQRLTGFLALFENGVRLLVYLSLFGPRHPTGLNGLTWRDPYPPRDRPASSVRRSPWRAACCGRGC
jgi:hypothetical protein